MIIELSERVRRRELKDMQRQKQKKTQACRRSEKGLRKRAEDRKEAYKIVKKKI